VKGICKRYSALGLTANVETPSVSNGLVLAVVVGGNLEHHLLIGPLGTANGLSLSIRKCTQGVPPFHRTLLVYLTCVCVCVLYIDIIYSLVYKGPRD
jgi:hypothetical protein